MGMRALFVSVILMVSAGLCRASTQPLTAREVSLMLRSGYSSEAVAHELSVRHFADALDPDIEKQLTQAGANPALLEILRSGTYQLSPSEIAALEQKQAVQEKRAGDVPGVVRDAAPIKKQGGPPPPSPKSSVASTGAVYRLLKGDLISWQKGSFTPFDDEALQSKKLFLFFFSANWSAPGRKFTPQLIEYYQGIVSQHPEVEVIFFSADRSQFGMETYMSQSNMPWPAVAFPQISQKAAAMETESLREMPCLILVDASGNILSTSAGSDVGPKDVLTTLDRILAGGKERVGP